MVMDGICGSDILLVSVAFEDALVENAAFGFYELPGAVSGERVYNDDLIGNAFNGLHTPQNILFLIECNDYDR
jgi:hypothetical protein